MQGASGQRPVELHLIRLCRDADFLVSDAIQRRIALQWRQTPPLPLRRDEACHLRNGVRDPDDGHCEHLGQVHSLGTVGGQSARRAKAEAAVSRVEHVREVRGRSGDGLVRGTYIAGKTDVFADAPIGITAGAQAIAQGSIAREHVRERSRARHLLAVCLGRRVEVAVANQRRQSARRAQPSNGLLDAAETLAHTPLWRRPGGGDDSGENPPDGSHLRASGSVGEHLDGVFAALPEQDPSRERGAGAAQLHLLHLARRPGDVEARVPEPLFQRARDVHGLPGLNAARNVREGRAMERRQRTDHRAAVPQLRRSHPDAAEPAGLRIKLARGAIGARRRADGRDAGDR